ncbi:remorin-like isoform X2 [Cicer arietinum]|uniref:Remorin-like isoform X2 n=1 Tax=Cicer arietinum TaxID=3827 RepID=A0A1S2YXN8_CICAR|nr:remorin-like isoform X2 [Cicer arietinum]
MGEEDSNINKTEPESLDSVPEENFTIQENESEKPNTLNTINHESNELVASSLDPKVVDHADSKETGEHDDKKDTTRDSTDAGLTRIVTEKRLALIKAWEESEKTKAENRAYKKQSAVVLWEESRKASIEAQLKKFEDKLERKKVEYVEKMKNEIAEIHQYAEEKRAIVEAQKGEEILELEETASKFRSRGVVPRKFFGCFSG